MRQHTFLWSMARCATYDLGGKQLMIATLTRRIRDDFKGAQRQAEGCAKILCQIANNDARKTVSKHFRKPIVFYIISPLQIPNSAESCEQEHFYMGAEGKKKHKRNRKRTGNKNEQ